MSAPRGVNAPETEALIESMSRRIAALALDLTGLDVVTEAATGAYACTATIAAMAGARRVVARARDTRRHGSALDGATATLGLARAAGVAERIEVVEEIEETHLARCDILTNSGHLRPITRSMIERLPPHAVIGLMFEAWEFRGPDLDLASCRERGIRIAAVNERHPDVGVFPFLGPLCVRLIEEAGLGPGARIGLVCDNPFAPFILDGLEKAGFPTDLGGSLSEIQGSAWDALVVALDPSRNEQLGRADFLHLRDVAPNATIAQFWGDMDRAAALETGYTVVPAVAPGPGHMGILLNALGPEPIVRLQAGGLKAAEILRRGGDVSPGGVAEIL